jgi:cytochrome c oxidase subunit 3
MAEKPLSPDVRDRSLFGLMVFLLSDSVVFLSLFVILIAFRFQNQVWLPSGIVRLEVRDPAINTFVLVASSGAIMLAENSLKRNHPWRFRFFWVLAITMGAAFLVGQYLEWMRVGFNIHSGLFGATFFLLTGFHGLHVFTGLLLLITVLARSFLVADYSGVSFGVSGAGLFWHFVDGIWIVLFTLLYLWSP